jgi:hypothetical protein
MKDVQKAARKAILWAAQTAGLLADTTARQQDATRADSRVVRLDGL